MTVGVLADSATTLSWMGLSGMWVIRDAISTVHKVPCFKNIRNMRNLTYYRRHFVYFHLLFGYMELNGHELQIQSMSIADLHKHRSSLETWQR